MTPLSKVIIAVAAVLALAFAVSPAAAACNVSGCKTCAPGFDRICIACDAGYTMTNTGGCAPKGGDGTGTSGAPTVTTAAPDVTGCNVQHCEMCFLKDPTKCTRCERGFVVTYTRVCQRQTQGVQGTAGITALATAVIVVVLGAATL